MPLTRFNADGLGLVTISLVALFDVFAVRCIYQVAYARLRTQRRDFLQLGYFNGPWFTRIFLVLVAICWSLTELARLSFLKGKLISNITWQTHMCKLYILFNLGLSEPCVFLTLVLLLRASIQKTESGPLSRGWNKRTICYVFLFCLPIFVMQLILVFSGTKFFNEDRSIGRTNKAKYYLAKTSVLTGDERLCIYPLFSTILLGLFHAALISCASYIGICVLSSVINKRLLRRLYWLVFTIIFSLPVRVLLLGFSSLPHPGTLAQELTVFLSFLIMLFCTVVGIIILVYLPVQDSKPLGDTEEGEMLEMPFDDYYNDNSSLTANQNHHGTRRNSDASTKRGSISFRTMIKDDAPSTDGFDENSLSFHGALQIGSLSGSFPTPARSMLPLTQVPSY